MPERVTQSHDALRFIPPSLLPILLSVFCFYPAPANADLSTLLHQADALRLAESPAWRALLHIPKNAHESLIDDPAFFLAQDGKTDPRAELIATLTALTTSASGPDDTSTACRFIARRHWLKENLPGAADLFGKPACPEWDALRERLKPDSVTLVYPAGHLNSPASMFGHTLLRIDPENRQPLLGYAVNYSARTNEENGLLFAYYGIFGHYKGYYSLLPYPEKLREYRFTEQRDMWEYRLTLTPPETERLLEHTWELKEIFSYYYFFDENCSYNLLALLEAARPDLDLMSDAGVAVIPSDTLRQIKANRLVAETRYRPSHVSLLNRMQRELNRSDIDTVKHLTDPAADPARIELPATHDQRRLILDTAIEFLQYRQSTKAITGAAFRERYLHLLKARSQTGGVSRDWRPTPAEPTTGHKSNLFAAGIENQSGAVAGVVRLRPAYHGLEDRPEGFLTGAAINFLDTRLRIRGDDPEIVLESLRILEINSLAPATALLHPVSWRVSLGIEPDRPLVYDQHYCGLLDVGAGKTFDLTGTGKIVYGLVQLRAGDSHEHGFIGALGIRAGAVLDLGHALNATLIGEHWRYIAGQEGHENSLNLDIGWHYQPDRALHVTGRLASPRTHSGDPVIGVSYHRFF